MRSNRRTFYAIYYGVVVALIAVGVVLWATGHGTGDPYLSVGVALALVPIALIWLRKLFGRD